MTSVVLSDMIRLPLFRGPGFVIAALHRGGPPDRPGRRIGQRGPRQVFLMRLFPRLARQRLFRRHLVERVMQPAMPIRAHAARLGFAVEDHPPLLAIARDIEAIALIVLAHLHALAPSVELSVERLPVPPCDRPQKGVENAHEDLRYDAPDMAQSAPKVQCRLQAAAGADRMARARTRKARENGSRALWFRC